MKNYFKISTYFFALFITVCLPKSGLSQNPTVINDSLVINNRVYAKEKLIVDKEAKFKQDIIVNGSARIKTDMRVDSTLRVDGPSKLNGTVRMNNLGYATELTAASEIIIILPNGQLTKGTVSGIISAFANPASINADYCGANGGVAQWWAGVNKLFTACPDVNVGIRTDNPQFALHVVGINYAQKFLAGNSGGTTNAVFNGFAQNTTDDLLNLGVKIGGTQEEVRFKIQNDGTVYSKEIRVRLVEDFPDYVFDESYALMSLYDLRDYINQNKHLPNMPSASEVSGKGMALGDITLHLVEKVEELTLYSIQLKEENDDLRSEIDYLKSEIEAIKVSLSQK